MYNNNILNEKLSITLRINLHYMRIVSFLHCLGSHYLAKKSALMKSHTLLLSSPNICSTSLVLAGVLISTRPSPSNRLFSFIILNFLLECMVVSNFCSS